MKKKMSKTLLTAIGILCAANINAYAGQWVQNDSGWWYDYGNGTYPANSWQWIDGNNDGVAECYYFDMYGYVLMNTTTPDGYTVDGNGAWIVNGAIQSKNVANASTNNQEVSNIQPVNLLDLSPTTSSGFQTITNKRTIQGSLWSDGFQIMNNLYSRDGWVNFYAGGGYQTLTATLGMLKSGNGANMTIEVYGDNDVLLDSFEIDPYTDPYEINVDISGQKNIKIVNVHISGEPNGWALFKNAQFK